MVIRVGRGLLVLGLSCWLPACGATKSNPSEASGGDGSSDGSGGVPSGVLAPPPSQGAGIFSLRAPSPPIPGKMCPSGQSTSSVPATEGPNVLDADTYVAHIIDGENGAEVSCKVSVDSGITFEGTLRLGSVSLRIDSGVLGADNTGTADITLRDAQAFSGALTSPAPCSIDATSSPTQNFQVKAGSMWASFRCPSVEQVPTDSCMASGVFVLENCER